MRSFYLEYKENEKLSQMAREISWTNNCVIIAKCKEEREREFYMQMTKRFDMKALLPEPDVIAARLAAFEENVDF